ncbi:hypothetical protein XBO1_1230050 [Xenorhabdus bovienii str. oregonense]|uniref:Uncharacterized protein n=1 Tax=Xenorhabdus bovienii str. oregonense TaxID=1398202 RepID=A0A077P0N5_XENBV|nr:hypothetical protein XBO1_1230050 [Xenorhabdus bovienii str. oregonense]
MRVDDLLQKCDHLCVLAAVLSSWSCIQYMYCEFYCVEPIAAYNTKITL